MTYSWAEADGKLAPALLAGTSRDPRQLRLAPGTLAAQTKYTFVVTCAMTQYPERVNTARVIVVVGSQALVARIAGGAQTQVQSKVYDKLKKSQGQTQCIRSVRAARLRWTGRRQVILTSSPTH